MSGRKLGIDSIWKCLSNVMNKKSFFTKVFALGLMALGLAQASCNKKQLDSGSNGSGGRSAAPC